MDARVDGGDLLHPVPGLRHSRGDAIDSRRVLDVLVNNLDGMVFRCAIDAEWTFHLVSDGCHALCGYRAGELLQGGAVTWEKLTHPEDRQRVRHAIMSAVARSEHYRVQYRICCRGGCEKWVLERGAAAVDEGGRRVIEGFIEDISELVASQRQLADAELRYRRIFEDSVVGMFQTSPDGHYLAANRALATLYGYDSPAALIADLGDIANFLYIDHGRRDEFKRRMAAEGRVTDFQSEVYRRDGSRIWIAENAHVVLDAAGTTVCYEGTVEDITERHHYRTQLEYQASHDPLTGLPNRNLLEDRLEQALCRVRRQQGQGAVAFVDLDNFKFINDSLGHGAGDAALIEMAGRLRRCLRDTETMARYGGDEFVLILSGDLTVPDTVHALERVQAAVAAPVLLDGRELQVNCSMGVSCFPADGDTLEALLRHADAAMHHAKTLGKGQFQFYTAALNAAAQERLDMEAALRRALGNGELSVVYQPKVRGHGRVSGAEALVRWNSRDFGNVSPTRFIPLAEEIGLIGELTDFVLATACREAASWQQAGRAPLRVAVNISPRLFRERDLAARIAAVLVEARLPAGCLEVEITEGMVMGDVQRALVVLQELKAMGIGIAIDDFGTGYSSLAYLKRFPIDILKVDRSFVMECDQGAEAAAIARAIVTLAHSLGLQVVAEGVETASQLAVLVALGCQEFQGYLFAKPLPAEALQDYLAAPGGTAAGS